MPVISYNEPVTSWEFPKDDGLQDEFKIALFSLIIGDENQA